MTNIFIHKVKCIVKIGNRLSGEKLLHSILLNSNNLKSALRQNTRDSEMKTPLHLNTLELNLGTITAEQFDMQFNQRLSKIFSQCLAREQVTSERLQEEPQQWINEYQLDGKELFQHAIDCFRPAILKSLLQNSPANYLQQLLKRLLIGGGQSTETVPASWYGQVTSGRLSIAAALYLLNSQQGHDWLISQRSLPASQATHWATAIAQEEIPPEQVAMLLTGNRLSNNTLADQRLYPPLLVMRWLLPLWQQPAVRQMIRRLNGRRGVQQVDVYLSRCLQGREEPAMQGTLSRDYSMSKGGEESKITSQELIQPRGGNLLISNDQRSTSQSISNAGLLLLWPLLPQLFSQLGLWDGEQFVSDAARSQAECCLDRLVWGESNPADEQVTLNKLLCGISHLKPTLSANPLDVLQQQHVDNWLIAIGQQLPGWQKLSLVDIQQLFLQRAGEITTEEMFLQIRVRSEPYDYLLRDWPWPMTLATLPWTEQPFTIEWSLKDLTK